ncbi:MAG TPA: hypothetical protein VG269_15950 [Tepidisphaeraceae bacterium]|jgi:hypothetical protein|nr:hypothetical protein [Tepidisphaeraceae bacterium]
MKRRLFAIASGISLLLCLGTCVLWVRSYGGPQALFFGSKVFGEGQGAAVTSFYGELIVIRCVMRSDHPFAVRYYSNGPELAQVVLMIYMGIDDTTLGFSYGDHSGSGFRILVFPTWAVVAPFLPLPVVWIGSKLRRHRRTRRNQCPACGYDLRATPDKCPECGAIPAGKANVPPARP